MKVQSLAQRVIVQNTGSARLSMPPLEVAGVNGIDDFSYQNGCPVTLPSRRNVHH